MLPPLHGNTTADTSLSALVCSVGHHLHAVSGTDGALGAGWSAPQCHLASALPGEQHAHTTRQTHGGDEDGDPQEEQGRCPSDDCNSDRTWLRPATAGGYYPRLHGGRTTQEGNDRRRVRYHDSHPRPSD